MSKPTPTFHLFRSPRADKKYAVVAPDSTIRIDFGAKGYSDYTKHKDPERKQQYLYRHAREDHSPGGIYTAGFWARWLLWNKSTITESIKDIEKNFRINIIFHKYSR